MAIFEISLGQPYLNEIIRIIMYLAIFHIIISFTGHSDMHVFGLGGKLFNWAFIWTLLILALTVFTYHFVIKEIIEIY